MMRRILVVVLGWGSLLAAATSLEPPPVPSSHFDPVDSARAEMDVGRHWHAALILERVQAAGDAGPAELLLLSRARAGYHDWPGVAAILEDAPFLDTLDEGAGWGLLARAREESGDWGGAAEAYGHLLAAPAGGGDARPVQLVRRARALARAGEASLAASVLEALQGRRPELASWAAYEFLLDLETPSDTLLVHRLLRLVSEEDPQRRLSGFWARALLLAGDTTGKHDWFGYN